MINVTVKEFGGADCDRTNRCSRLEQIALTKMALMMQEASQSKAFGRFAIELDYQNGEIQRIRRITSVTEL